MTVTEFTAHFSLSPDAISETKDGFCLCRTCMADLLLSIGIADTGISQDNTRDVTAYYDDWHLYCIENRWGLVKMREQEYDYVPGFSDRDDPGITVSFIRFPIEKLCNLLHSREALPEFVEAFRRGTEYRGQKHEPVFQRYFSDPASQGSFLIANCYLQKLAGLSQAGTLPLPDKMQPPPRRVQTGLCTIAQKTGASICDFEHRKIRLKNPQNLTHGEKCALLACHTGNLSFCSFASEVKFHSDALIAWQNRLPKPLAGIWYSAAIRADMQIEPDRPLVRALGLMPYYDENSKLMKEMRKIHGDI